MGGVEVGFLGLGLSRGGDAGDWGGVRMRDGGLGSWGWRCRGRGDAGDLGGVGMVGKSYAFIRVPIISDLAGSKPRLWVPQVAVLRDLCCSARLAQVSEYRDLV